MIKIINKGPFDDPDLGGLRKYEVYINQEFICDFEHERIDGLAACLNKAARAVAQKMFENTLKIFKENANNRFLEDVYKKRQ